MDDNPLSVFAGENVLKCTNPDLCTSDTDDKVQLHMTKHVQFTDHAGP